MPLNAFLSNQGTQTSLLTDNTGGTAGTLVPVMKIDTSAVGTAGTIWGGGVYVTAGTIGAGTVVNNGGTIGTIQNIAGGTVSNNMLSGTLNLGTVRVDGRPTQNVLSFGTQVAGTAAVAATIVGSASVGAGTYLWLNDLSVNNPNANVGVIVGFGTAQQGTNVLLRGTYGTSGAVGHEKVFPKAVNAGMTNQDLVVSLTAAGTVDINISYFISA